MSHAVGLSLTGNLAARRASSPARRGSMGSPDDHLPEERRNTGIRPRQIILNRRRKPVGPSLGLRVATTMAGLSGTVWRGFRYRLASGLPVTMRDVGGACALLPPAPGDCGELPPQPPVQCRATLGGGIEFLIPRRRTARPVAPLLQEERHIRRNALVAQPPHPLRIGVRHIPTPGLTTTDDPADSVQFQVRQIGQQRLAGQEPQCGLDPRQRFEQRQALGVADGRADPVRRRCAGYDRPTAGDQRRLIPLPGSLATAGGLRRISRP